MKDPTRVPAFPRRFGQFLALGLLVATCGSTSTVAQTGVAATQPAAPSHWKWGASAAVKETFDSNVYLQSQTDKANQSSFVTTLIPQFSAAWNPAPVFGASLTYSPEASWFHAESAEDFVLHRTTLNLSGKAGKTAYESASSLIWIDGNSVSPTWTGPGGAPATGGPAVRDRRDAAVGRTSFRLTQELGKWFVRPVFTFYLHDFQTEQRTTAGYHNYVDRNEVTGGVDLGRRLSPALSVWAGYRYGVQDQSRLFAFPEEYDNTFHRVLFGIEGSPAKWLKLNLSLGPEMRRYGNRVPATFGDRDRENLFVDTTLTLLPTKADTVAVSIKQFQQPGFGGRSAYEDLTYDLVWRHKLDKRWTIGAGARAYNTDFLDPVKRNDWVLSANGVVNCALSAAWNVEASYVFEQGSTHDLNASGREYTRHLVALGVKYVFK